MLLALDFGGTKHTVALLRPGQTTWAGRLSEGRPPGADAQADLSIVFRLARRLLAGHAAAPDAVGVSFGGPVDFASGRVRLSHHVPGWADVPLRDLVQAEFRAPAAIDNDANCGALGEWGYGVGAAQAAEAQPAASVLYITVSTGIGGGWVINGQVYRGAGSMAGEIGHTIVDPGGPACVCGRHGCLEVMACGPAIARAARERLNAQPGGGALLRELAGGDPAAVTAELVSRAALGGDPLAEAVLLEAARHLGNGIGNALSLMNPWRIVLGGGVTKSGDRWWAEVRRAARANTLPEISADIVPAALGDDAPLWGAAALAASVSPMTPPSL